jgi:tetratricopeptide (TPR) repeat protein
VQEVLSGDMSLLTLLIIGVARYDVGDYEGAIQRFTKALDQLYSSQSENGADDVKFYLGKSLYGKGRYSEAVDRLQNVASKRGDDPDVLSWLGSALLNVGRYAEAEALYKRALEIDEKALGKDHPDTATSLNTLAVLYHHQGKYAEAEALYKRALEIREKAIGKDHPATATSLNDLANLYHRQGKYAEAEPLLKLALEITEKAIGKDHPATTLVLENYVYLLYKMNRDEEATKLAARADGGRKKSTQK